MEPEDATDRDAAVRKNNERYAGHLRPLLTPAEKNTLNRLSEALQNIDAQFWCGGTIQLGKTEKVGLLYRVGEGEDAKYISFPTEPEKIDKLVEACRTSPFGRGKKTVYDEDYRQARELSKDEFAITADILSTSGVLETISSLTVPLDKGGVAIARLNKLNIYTSRGFFRPHRDTPQQGRHIGSLIVALPSPYTGGILKATHEGREIQFSWDNHLSASDQKNISLPWAFLFSDVEHEVLPVTSGVRITLAFDIFASEGSQPGGVNIVEANTLPIFTDINDALKKHDFLPGGGKIAVALSHVYPVSNQTPKASSQVFPQDLKGSDAALYRALCALEIPVTICAVYSVDETIDDSDNDKDPSYNSVQDVAPDDGYSPVIKYEPYHLGACLSIPTTVLLTAEKFRFVDNDEWSTEELPDRLMIENEFGAALDPNIIWARRPILSGTRAGTYITYANMATLAAVYVNAAIIMDIPPTGKGVRETSRRQKRRRTY